VIRERLVDPNPSENEERKARELARRDMRLANFIGQRGAVHQLKEFAALYSKAGLPPAHVLLTGPDGLGKRTLARAFAAEYCGELLEAGSETFTRTHYLLRTLTNLGDGHAVLVADISRIQKGVGSLLAHALRDFHIDVPQDKGAFARTIHYPLKRFTCMATSQSMSECASELAEAFALTVPLQSYSQAELERICEQLASRRGFAMTPGAAVLVAGASNGTPHHIELLLERLAGVGKTAISEQGVAELAPVLGLDKKPAIAAGAIEIDGLSGVEFEKLVADLLHRMGFRAEVTEATGDGGIDIVATLDRPLIGGRYLIQCKGFAPGSLVGAAAVRDFYGALTADQSAIKGIFITTTGFTSQAVAFARGLPVELIGGEQLRLLLAQFQGSAEAQNPTGSLFGQP
jgi:Holliday junction resolvasome RuvABC ATP-dependent DNA helicase subunit